MDDVRFAPIRPFSPQRARLATDIGRSLQSQVAHSLPRVLGAAVALAQKGPPHDAEKVAELRVAVASGVYAVNLGAIADAMMQFGGEQDE